MDATFRAMLEHGYNDLSIADIADEFEMSKSSLYYHYDSKDDLLVSFLSFASDRFEEDVLTAPTGDPMTDLEHVVEKLLPLELDEERRAIQTVMSELRSQAVTNAAFREQFTDIDDLLVAHLRVVVERGIEDGSFREVDSTRVAEHVVATLNGARVARATTNRTGAPAAVRVSLASYLDTVLRGRR
ncbi:TetR family transcriptional regulator [Halomarina oriensis]|uniref:TetR family transcriptional regulator n=2 Tax=Halomarina oriensis TaxID=671145 RepID=A0A6B0GED1_9EURY|nr:TetR/AcrR family transcriptional regulator [Halomarina oriensis]MWG33064.1 TetR family transcriptional regulator [Halomarina oriensis]